MNELVKAPDEEHSGKFAAFDPYDKGSWYFGDISREESNRILMTEHDDGVFLVRDSATRPGSLVLCVRESGKESSVSQYIIHVQRDSDGNGQSYKIGQQTFADMPTLLNFYKLHYLETSPLVRPAIRELIRVRAKFEFTGQEDDDLPFKRGEALWVIRKDPSSWWMARNSIGQTGYIPANYVEEVDDEKAKRSSDTSSGSTGESAVAGKTKTAKSRSNPSIQRKLPAYARVKQARIPNAYDKSALRLQVGDMVKVLKMYSTGTWEGELNGKVGHFPFTYVEFEDDGAN
uniref:Adapter molecule Crk n=1 Tax=Trichuris muris TaxID=70415 RepID=A0A5S6R5D6_TRIMR